MTPHRVTAADLTRVQGTLVGDARGKALARRRPRLASISLEERVSKRGHRVGRPLTNPRGIQSEPRFLDAGSAMRMPVVSRGSSQECLRGQGESVCSFPLTPAAVARWV